MARSREQSLSLASLPGVGIAITIAIWLVTAIAAPAQAFNSLASFDNNNGAFPAYVSLIQGRDGNYYGTTYAGGGNDNSGCDTHDVGCGTVFKVGPRGKLIKLYSFCSQSNCPDGANPMAGLALGTDGDFYGTTYYGGANSGYGTVFKMSPSGALTTLHVFRSTDGANPGAPLLQGTDGNFYGTTVGGGSYGYGTVFKITSGGTLTTLYSFCSQSNCTDGANPYAGLVQGTDGSLYGTTEAGGAFRCAPKGCGTVFKITRGRLTRLYSFDGLYGAYPYAGLVQATDGNFYGTTLKGGRPGNGTVFKITIAGRHTLLYSFGSAGKFDGVLPTARLIQALDGNFYGTTSEGGTSGWGTAFKVSQGGTLTTLYSFCDPSSCHYGAFPDGGVFQATNGTFYGTTEIGGTDLSDCGSGCGTVFSLGMDLAPFVSLVRNSGKVGANVEILGQGFIGTTGISFNGTSAAFGVKSATYLTATVPAGATTGYVTVTTPHSTLPSNTQFRVIP
jgi:uncharacterized repeat protein (TIGR03803 family)